MSREFHCIEFRWRDGTISYTPVDKNHPDAFLVREVDEAKDAATLKLVEAVKEALDWLKDNDDFDIEPVKLELAEKLAEWEKCK